MGADLTCTGSPADYNPSYMMVKLDKTCDGFACSLQWATIRGPYRTSSSLDYASKKGVSYISPCSSSANYWYSVLADQYRQGVRIQQWDGFDALLACNVT